MTTHPNVLGLTLDQKLTYNTDIHNISVHAHKPLQIIKALATTGWGKRRRQSCLLTGLLWDRLWIMPLPYGFPFASSPGINKLQVMQKAALRTATGYTQDTIIQHMHEETLTLPIYKQLQLHVSQFKHKTQHPSHPLHKHITYFSTPRLKNTNL